MSCRTREHKMQSCANKRNIFVYVRHDQNICMPEQFSTWLHHRLHGGILQMPLDLDVIINLGRALCCSIFQNDRICKRYSTNIALFLIKSNIH